MSFGEISWLAKGATGYAVFSDRPKDLPIPKYATLSSEGEEMGEALPNRRIATRSTELFVAAGCEIRCIDLRDLKARCTEENEGTEGQAGKDTEISRLKLREYQVLDTPELDFNIHQLEVSPDGNYLAIVGEKKLAICILPTPGFARLNLKALRSTCKMVGTAFHNEAGDRIVRALWHPLGVDGASLTVLTSDGSVRLYDFTMHLEHTFSQPEQVLDLYALSGRERHKSSFTPDPEAFEPASCCYGSGEVGWRPFTLYILMRGGDIYALCPVVPSRWKAPVSYINSLGLDIKTRLDEIDETATMSDRMILRQQTKWINEVSEQAAIIEADSNLFLSIGKRKQDWFTRPEVVGPAPSLQGPFLMQPAPADPMEEYLGCDILHVSTDSIAILAVAYSNFSVDVFLEFEPLVAKWVGKKPRAKALEKEGELPVIASFETINLPVSLSKDSVVTNWPLLLEDPLVTEKLFVTHRAGVEAVDMAEWIQALKTVLDRDEDENFISKNIQRLKGSKVVKVVDTGKTLSTRAHPIVGSTVVQDSYLGYILIANTPGKVYSAEFDIPLQLRESVDQLHNTSIVSNDLDTSRNRLPQVKPPGYVPSILQPYYEPPPFLSQPPPLAHFIHGEFRKNPQLFRAPMNYNVETLEILRQGREQVRREYEKLMTVAEAICNRAKMQETEYKRQLAKVDELCEKIRKMREGDLKRRLEQGLKRQQELTTKADTLIKKLVMNGIANGGGVGAEMLELSKREKDWFAEVSKVEQRVKGSSRDALDVRKESSSKFLNQIRMHVKEIENDKENETKDSDDRGDGVPKELRQKKIEMLNGMLDKEGVLIDRTKLKTTKLEARIEAMGL